MKFYKKNCTQKSSSSSGKEKKKRSRASSIESLDRMYTFSLRKNPKMKEELK